MSEPGFVVFEGWNYEAQGGWFDCSGHFPSLAEAEAALNEPRGDETRFGDWAHIVDLSGMAVVRAYSRRDGQWVSEPWSSRQR